MRRTLFRFRPHATKSFKPDCTSFIQGTLGLFAGPLRRAGDIPIRAMEILRDYTKGFGSRFTYKDELWTQLFHRKDALATLNCLLITCRRVVMADIADSKCGNPLSLCKKADGIASDSAFN
jgi:hypothetical protein